MGSTKPRPLLAISGEPSGLRNRVSPCWAGAHGTAIAGLVALLAAAAALLVMLVSAPSTSVRASPSALTERQRFGFVATSPNWQGEFEVAQLRAGWYVDASNPACAFAPEGMERALLIHTYEGYAVDPSRLGPQVDSHPNTLWLIGNEPDCIWQDNVRPEEYAHIYHDLHTFIKARDPTSQVSPGGIVQPTPLRLEWLDRVLAKYQSDYGEAMPVDVWNIHNAILNEVSCDYDPYNCWGAEIPPGIEAGQGVSRSPGDNDNLVIFKDQIRTFRQWMANSGYAGYPLVVTEYGILMPDDFGFGVERVNDFMSATFDFFQTESGPLGDPTDGNRLVQRWAWFSLNVEPWDPITGEGFNGNLLDPDTKAITAHGLRYASHTASFQPLDYVDLVPGTIVALPASALVDPGDSISQTLRAEVVNMGTSHSGSFLVTLEYENGVLEQAVTDVPPVSSRWTTFTLADLESGRHTFSVSIDPDRNVVESTICNNQATGSLLVPTDRVYMPLIGNYNSLARPASVTEVPPSDLLVSSWPVMPQRAPLRFPLLAGTKDGSEPGAPMLRPDWPLGARSSGASLVVSGPPEATPQPGFREFEVPTANSYPARLTLDPVREVLWITERDANKIARFDLHTEEWAEYDIPTADSQPGGVAVDSEGNAWFAESGVDKIGKLVAASGTITEYAGLSSGSVPWGVTVSAAGTVWFTEKAGNRIAVLIPATGQITEHSVSTPGAAGPSGIAISGNRIWFTLTTSDQLGSYDITADRFLVASRPAGSRPQDIVVTGGGKPWFTETEGNRIVRFAPETTGLWTTVGVATSASEPYGIAMEGEVAVWFTERVGNRLGRYTGSVPPSEYPLPTANSLPTDIVVDSHGCAWYTAPGANRIGRLCLPPKIQLPVVLRNSTQDGVE